jgi:nucleotide-binding universal stress UspA family protein
MYHRILVPIDGSPNATAGLDEALRMARLTGGQLRLLHVLDAAAYANGFEPAAVYCSDVLPLMRRTGERVLQDGRSRARAAGVAADGVLLEVVAERVSDLVLAQAAIWGAELIVIGTHGRHGADRFFMGSDAEQILRSASVPVLLVRCPVDAAVTTRTAAPKPVEAHVLTQ